MKQRLLEKEKELLTTVQKTNPKLLREFPLSLSLSEIKACDHLQTSLIFSCKLERIFDKIKTKYGMAGIALYIKLLLTALIIDSSNRLKERRIPENIISLYNSWFERIYADFSSQPDFYYDYKKEFWSIRQDLCICSERIIPVGGAWFIELRMLPRKFMVKQAKQWCQDENVENQHHRQSLLKPLNTILKPLGLHKIVMRMFAMAPTILGGSWCYVIHTIQRNILDFNHEQMNIAYRNIVELLQLDHSIWGVFRKSWLLDPALQEISPNLGFLREIPLINGAELFYSGSCNALEIRHATMFSSVREQLYQKGLYKPNRYFYFWPRKEVIEGRYDN